MAASFAEPQVTDLIRFEVVSHGSSVRLVVTGEIDSSTAPALERHLDGIFDGQLDQLTVDLCAVTFLDSAGLWQLLGVEQVESEDDAQIVA